MNTNFTKCHIYSNWLKSDLQFWQINIHNQENDWNVNINNIPILNFNNPNFG